MFLTRSEKNIRIRLIKYKQRVTVESGMSSLQMYAAAYLRGNLCFVCVYFWQNTPAGVLQIKEKGGDVSCFRFSRKREEASGLR